MKDKVISGRLERKLWLVPDSAGSHSVRVMVPASLHLSAASPSQPEARRPVSLDQLVEGESMSLWILQDQSLALLMAYFHSEAHESEIQSKGMGDGPDDCYRSTFIKIMAFYISCPNPTSTSVEKLGTNTKIKIEKLPLSELSTRAVASAGSGSLRGAGGGVGGVDGDTTDGTDGTEGAGCTASLPTAATFTLGLRNTAW